MGATPSLLKVTQVSLEVSRLPLGLHFRPFLLGSAGASGPAGNRAHPWGGGLGPSEPNFTMHVGTMLRSREPKG